MCRFDDSQSPFEIINFAEHVGLTHDFDLCVVRKVLETFAYRPPQKRRPNISVNLSARSLEQDGFVDNLLNLLGDVGSLAGSLVFEITESAEIRNLDRMAKVIDRLRARGHRVALDDFGAGAAAFHYIRSLKVDHVKVDGAYVQRIVSSKRDCSIVRAMTELCKNLGVSTIAEMIEEEEQVRLLQDIGVDSGQGFLFARPSPSIDLPSPLLPRLANLPAVEMA